MGQNQGLNNPKFLNHEMKNSNYNMSHPTPNRATGTISSSIRDIGLNPTSLGSLPPLHPGNANIIPIP